MSAKKQKNIKKEQIKRTSEHSNWDDKCTRGNQQDAEDWISHLEDMVVEITQLQ